MARSEPVPTLPEPPIWKGDFGVMPGHVPTVAQLRPGVVTVHNTLDKEVDKCAPPCHTALSGPFDPVPYTRDPDSEIMLVRDTQSSWAVSLTSRVYG